MSDTVEPLEEAPKTKAPEPIPEAPVAAPPARTSGALFDTGMGAGMGSPTGLIRQLARSSVEDRKAGIEDLNDRVGNRRTTRMIARSGAATAAKPKSAALERALQTKEIGDIKAVRDFTPASVEERLEFIDILLDQVWVGPADELACERIWSSFGPTQMAQIYAGGEKTKWEECIKRGMDPSNITALKHLRRSFESDVKAVAYDYMRRNREFVEGQMDNLGLRPTGGPQSPTAALEQQLALEEIQELAKGAEELLKLKDHMLTVHVGYDPLPAGYGGGARMPAKFKPEKKPVFKEAGPFQTMSPPPEKTWDEVKQLWDLANAALAGIGAKNPTVFAAMASGKDKVSSLANDDPATAKQTAQTVLTDTLANIKATVPKLATGDLDWRDLKPIHQQLYDGKVKGPSKENWANGFEKSVAEDLIGDHESREFWITLGIGTASAALFIVAEIATGGLATAALLGGLAVSGGQAIASWENYEDLATAAGSTASEQTRLISQGQVDAALLSAILDTLFLGLDIKGAVTVGKGLLGAARLEAALAENSAEAALEAGLREGGEAASAAIERAISELGVEATMRKTGISSIDELLERLPDQSKHFERVARMRGIVEGGAKMEEGYVRLAMTAGNEAEEAWKAGRSLEELIFDVRAAVKSGHISVKFADEIVSEGIERMGPAAVLKQAGGWRKLQQTLGEGPAGKRLMQWRDSVFDDLENYVVKELNGEVKRTGSNLRFANDIDMSFTGPRAAEVREAASKYLAARLGVDNSPASFDHLMTAGLFTDPRRMHAYDGLPDSVRDLVAREQAAKQEQLIWNRRLFEATQEKADDMAKHIRDEMKKLGIPEFAYKPLSQGDIARLAKRIDSLHGQLETAVRNGDVTRQRALAQEIGDAQALINAAEEGGYFTGGGVRRYASERPGEKPFERLPGGEGQAIPTPERFTALAEQLHKLDHSLLMLSGPVDILADGVRGIAKYGKRLYETMGDGGLFRDDVWRKLADECDLLKSQVEAGASSMAKAEADVLANNARALFGELTAKSADALAQLRAGANLPNVGDAMKYIQQMTVLHTRLLRSTDFVLRYIHLLARGVKPAVHPEYQPDAGPMSTADQNMSVDPALIP